MSTKSALLGISIHDPGCDWQNGTYDNGNWRCACATWAVRDAQRADVYAAGFAEATAQADARWLAAVDEMKRELSTARPPMACWSSAGCLDELRRRMAVKP